MKTYISILAFILFFNNLVHAQHYPAVFDISTLNGSNGFVVPSLTPNTNDGFGTEVRFIGDINNDGIEDMAIASGEATVGEHKLAGRAYIIFGSTTEFPASFDLNSLDGTNGFIVEAVGYDERRGSTLAGPGDINGDGIDDLIVGSSNTRADEMVIYGANSFMPRITVEDIDGNNGFLIDTPGSNQVDKLGDVNGDGINDFIIATPHFSGQAWILFGRADNFPDMVTSSYLDGVKGFRTSSFPASRASYQVGGAGDFNNDGYNDMLIGSWNHYNDVSAQISYALFGKGTPFEPLVKLPDVDGSDGFLIDNRGGGFLTFVGPLGDINGDGIDDFFSERNFVYGSEDPFPASLMIEDIDGSNGFVFQNGVLCASPAGDLNQDGIDDFLVLSGGVNVIFGSTGGFSASFDPATLNGNNGFFVEGGRSNIGRPIDGGKDVNGDGLPDFIFGHGKSSSVCVVFGGDHYALPLNEEYPQAKDEKPSGFDLAVNAQEEGAIHYAVFVDGTARSVNYKVIKNGTGSVLHNSFAVNTANIEITELITDLDANTTYDVYLYFEDAAGNKGEIYPLENVTTTNLQAPFITTWNTANPGTSNDDQITIPTTDTGYNYDIYWEEEGNPTNNGTLTNQTGNVTITFPSSGIYRVEISGDFPRIFFNNAGDKEKILTVEQWGDIAWTSMKYAFTGCKNLTIPATDAPNLSGVTDMSWMFREATSLNQPIGHWDVSQITNMIGLFYGASAFNQDISSWDVGNVTAMAVMFQQATSFNQPIGSWNVGKVNSMTSMFNQASSFNQDIGGWDVSRLVYMRSMFSQAKAFNQDLDSWNVSNAQNMSWMFYMATSFNGNIGSWNVSKVSDMSGMFRNASSFNQDISNWDVSNVTTMSGMFIGASSFNQPIGGWNVSNVTSMSSMFSSASAFNQPIGSWNVSQVTIMSNMFSGATAFTQDVSNWDVSKVTNMSYMFARVPAFNQDISSWNVSNVRSINGMFYGASSFNQDISSWDVNNVTNMKEVFRNASSFNQDISNWDVSSVTDMTSMFDGSALSSCNYDAILKGWSQLTLQNGVSFGAANSKYTSEAATAHQAIIDNFGWTITDGGELNTAIAIAITQEISCAGASDGSLEASATEGSPSFTWYNEAATNLGSGATLEGAGAGTYTLEADFGGGCTYSETITLADPQDTEKPSITCPDDQTLAAGETLPDYTGLATASDNCDDAPAITQSPAAGTAFTDGMTVTLTATDAGGNTANCTFVVNEEADTQAPDITCPKDQTVACNATTIPDYTGLVSASDNKDANPIIKQSPAAGSAFTEGMTITMTAEDEAGNSNTCTFVVNAAPDNSAPSITCPGNQSLEPGESLPDYTNLATVTDNCDDAPAITQSPAAGSSFTSGMTITLTATDKSGNTSECSFIVNEEGDNEAPVITCPGNQEIACDASTIPDYTSFVTAEDNEDSKPEIRQSPVAGSEFTDGMTITMTAEDEAGNTSSCTFTVNKAANEAPEISCPAKQVVHVEADCQAILPDYRGLVGVDGECTGEIVITQSPEAGTPITTKTQVELTATSSSGKTTSCKFEVNVQGDVLPTVEAGEDVSIVLGESRQLAITTSSEGSYRWEPATGLDNPFVSNPVASPETTTTYKVTFTTESGCIAEDQINITVLDMVIPKGFSPDNDGINDYWVIRGIENYPGNEVSVFNRWGDRVFGIKGYDNSSKVFTGQANQLNQIGAGALPEGTYFYTITLSDEVKPVKGFLVLRK